MASHDKGWGAKLDRLLAHHEQAAAAIRLTIELLNGAAKAAKASGNGHAAVIAEAIALDGARVANVAKAKPAKGKHTRAHEHARRARTAQVLDRYDLKTPRAAGDVARELGLTVAQTGVAPLLHTGYLKRKRGGFVRTAKPFVVNLHAPAAEG